MKDQERKLRNLGLALEHIYGSRTNDDYRDFVEDWEMGYYDSEYFSDEDGVFIRKGGGYVPSRYAA